MIISCLHTADSNVAVFESAARQLGVSDVTLRHAVRADLLGAAELAGGLSEEITEETAVILSALAREADVVLLTCSTLGPSVAKAGMGAAVPILRVDAALAEKAAAAGGKVVALCAVETTVAPTTALFAAAAHRSGADIEVRLVEGAWALFKEGNRDGYLAAVAQAAEAGYGDGATIVALAQASMTGAADHVRNGPRPLSSPAAGLEAAMSAVAGWR
ncbi:Asp/Glu racemase [Ensifer adhaerens]|uniref:Asp/Glu racemase n=1 Tax=Ensifer adhaerens TaxID=106592 RepID=UPI001CBF2870|nr:Asp/Glu racemase [Ensifer adhaerens]MBZ7921950.1 Asp/Glu racemase [Ensifer adhaerens]UAX94345.1 Asp/Glu racemase [Ensifer adhaerens]UAY01980.1 Asp/Glu racemase [Ensifer adhaerens]UAY09363.1 Asp/Glu racemase [Ensifer adhaerens]